MHAPPPSSSTGWVPKFRNAFRGLRYAVVGQSSFTVHFLMAAAVLVAAAVMRMNVPQWAVLLICIFVVLTAEALNSALEFMAQAITKEHDEHIGKALDAASGAVLIASIGAAIVGLLVFIDQLIRLWTA